MDAESQSETETQAQPGEVVKLGSRFRIDLGAPQPQFDSAGAQAYAAVDLNLGGRVIALVRNTHAVWRGAVADYLADPDSPIEGLPAVRGQGRPAFPSGIRPLVSVIDQPGIAAVGPKAGARVAPMPEAIIRKVLLPGILPALGGLWGNGFAHRRLRPDTIFWTDAAHSKVGLGECFSESAGLGQHPAFETIERAMTIPEGRGEGGETEDLFALGVTILVLSLGYWPWLDVELADLLRARLELGSYQALTSGIKVDQALVSPLRFLLRDDANTRWTLPDLVKWLGGNSVSGRTAKPVKSFISAFVFEGVVMADRRRLALALAAKPDAATVAIRSDAFRDWLNSGFNDPEEAGEITRIIDGTVGRRSTGTDLVALSRIVMRLDPAGPIRIGTLAFAHDGFTPVLANALATGQREHMRLLDDAVSSGLFLEAAARHVKTSGSGAPMRLASQAEDLMSRRETGWGLERCLYTLAPGFPCLSPVLVPGSVLSLEDILPGLNQSIDMQRGALLPLDRHIVAFALANLIDARLAAPFGVAADGGGGLPALRFLAEIQVRTGGGSFRSVATELGTVLSPSVNAIRGRTRRRVLLDALERFVRAGDLMAMFRGLDLVREAQRDLDGFRAARRRFAANAREIGGVIRGPSAKQPEIVQAGDTIAMIIAAIPLVCVAGFLLLRVLP